MTKLKLGAIPDVLARETGQKNEAAKLIAPMLARFMATDRGFSKSRKSGRSPYSPRSTSEPQIT